MTPLDRTYMTNYGSSLPSTAFTYFILINTVTLKSGSDSLKVNKNGIM